MRKELSWGKTAWAVSLVVALFFTPVVQGQALNWDDGTWLRDPILGQPFGTAIQEAFATTLERSWYPLLRLSFWLEHRLAGPEGPVSHGLNVLLLGACCGLLVSLLRRVNLGKDVSILVVLFWGLHPLRVESVAWITGRKDLLSLALCLGTALLLTPLSGTKPGRLHRVFAHLLFACALLVKSLVAPLAGLLWLLVWMSEGPATAWRRCGGLLALAAADTLIAGLVLESGPGTPARPGEGFWENLAISSHFMGVWLQNTIAPFDLAAIYPLPEKPWRVGLFGLTIPLLALASAGIAAQRGSRRSVILVGLWFIPLLPVCGLVPLAFWGADRWLLLSSLALLIPLATWLENLRERNPRLGLIAAGAILLVLASASRQRMADWQTSVSLWEADTSRSGEHWVRWLNLGGAYGGQGRFEDARRALRRAESLRPDDHGVRAHRMFADLAVKGLNPARQAAVALLEPPPETSFAWIQAGIALMASRDHELAREAFQSAGREGEEDLRASLGTALAEQRLGEDRKNDSQEILLGWEQDHSGEDPGLQQVPCGWLAELEAWEHTVRCVEQRRRLGKSELADEIAAVFAHHSLGHPVEAEQAAARATAMRPGLEAQDILERLPARDQIVPDISTAGPDREGSP